MYIGLLGYSFEEFDDGSTYIDKARGVITLPAEEVDGVGTGSVIAVFSLVDSSIMTIIERVSNSNGALTHINKEVDEFNNSQKAYVAVVDVTDDNSYIDIVTSTKDIYDKVNETFR